MGIVVRTEKNFNCDVDVDLDVLISDRPTSSSATDDCEQDNGPSYFDLRYNGCAIEDYQVQCH